MSNWTHVAGIIRVDYLKWDDTPELNFDELIGKECLFESDSKIWDDADNNPDKYLPMGSEGSLKKSVWINPDEGSIARYTVSIFGDLRNHDNPQKIIDWFKGKCNELSIRQAFITVENEWNGTLDWRYGNGN